MSSQINNDNFGLFKKEVENAIARYGFHVSDIDYINLDMVYSVSPEIFFTLQSFPSVVANKYEHVQWCNNWDVPHDFRVVMQNGTIFLYSTASDEYYSRWICVQPVHKSPIAITT